MEPCFIRFIRKNKKITQKELAVMVGVSTRTIINWENNHKKISKKNKEKIKNILQNLNKYNKINT